MATQGVVQGVVQGQVVQGQVVQGVVQGTMAGAVVQQQAAPSGSSFEIIGDRYQILNVTLAPGDGVTCDPGTMMHMGNDVKMQAKFGGISRMVSGEELFKTFLKNEGQENQLVGVTPCVPMGVILPVNLPAVGGTLVCKRGAFLAGMGENVKVRLKLLPTGDLMACLCGGMAPIVQEVYGDSYAFLGVTGTLVTHTLQAGEDIVCDTESIVAFTNTIQFGVRQVGDVKMCCCGGEGCYNTVLTGPGTVYIQSLNVAKLVRSLQMGR